MMMPMKRSAHVSDKLGTFSVVRKLAHAGYLRRGCHSDLPDGDEMFLIGKQARRARRSILKGEPWPRSAPI